MPKTRQQRLAEERAGHPPSPPQFLEDKPRGQKCTRAKIPSATVAAGPVVLAAQSAVSGEPQALLHVWVDAGPEASGRPVDDPTHQLTIPSSLVPELVTFIQKIRNENKQNAPETSPKPSVDQETPSQAMAEAIPPTQSESVQSTALPAQNQTADRPTNKKRPAFRRNPLLPSPAVLKSLPVPAALDTSAADATPLMFRGDSTIASSKSNDATSQQPEHEVPADKDSDMDGVCETGSTIGHSESAIQTVTQPSQEGSLMPETPRGGKWGFGRLMQSARSIKRRLGFSPLAPVLESSESFPQASAMRTATQVPTETAALVQPKKTSSPPSSARDARARNRRHEDSVIKPVKPTTAGSTQRARVSRAKEASPESGETEGPGAEEENSSATGFTIRGEGQNAEGEAEQMEIQEPAAQPAIRWPSRSLDRMNQNKRKRCDESIAGPGEAGIYGDSEDGETEQQPGKIRRTSESDEFASQVTGRSNTARPYENRGGNIFAEYEAAQKAENTGRQSITNFAGTFKVPSPSDSDWSDSGSEGEEGNTAGLEDMTPSRTSNWEFGSANPRFGLPKSQQISRPLEYTALRKVQEKALQYKPRNPSRLSQSSRAHSSPPVEAADKRDSGPQAAVEPSIAVEPQPTGRTNFTGFEDWSKTATPAVTAALETMEVGSNMAGIAFARGLEDPAAGRTNRFTGFEEWSKTAPPAVIAVLEHMEVDSNFAGQAFKSGLDNFITPK